MRLLFTALVFLIMSCSNCEYTDKDTSESDITDTLRSTTPSAYNDTLTALKIYFNARFKNVTVKKTAPDTYKVNGEGQIFEASFNWVVEDGHNELKTGYATTDAGAPAWGKFDFTVTIPKPRENSVLHLILFEASAEDGRRTHELPVILH